MATTVLSGTSGALYYKPAGTSSTFAPAGVNIATETITVPTYLGYRVGDPVNFSLVNTTTGAAGTGTLPAGLATATTYYIISYTASTGAMQVSATEGGAAVDLTNVGTAVSPNKFQVAYDAFVAVGQVREWSFEMSRAEIDVTTIGQGNQQYVPFRTFIAGFGEGSDLRRSILRTKTQIWATVLSRTFYSANKQVQPSSCILTVCLQAVLLTTH